MPLTADSRRIEPFLAPSCMGPYSGTVPTASAVTLQNLQENHWRVTQEDLCLCKGVKKRQTKPSCVFEHIGWQWTSREIPTFRICAGPSHSLTPSLQCVGVSGRRHPSAGELSEQTSSPGRLSDGDGWCCCSWDVSTYLPKHDNNILTRGSCMNSTLLGTRKAQIPLLSSFSVRQRYKGW
jgi:hypothetical protein